MNHDKKKEDEFEEVLNKFMGLIRIHIHKFNPQKFGLDPEDILQEIKIKLWRILLNEREINNFPSYIKKVINSSVIDMLRRWRRDEGIYLHERQKNISEAQDEYLAELRGEDNLKAIVAEAVNSLIASRRKVVKLFLLGMTIEEISLFFNWSQAKTRNLLYRGLADLKRILKKKDIDYENE